jgi:uncharacterized membrane protein
MTTGSPPRTWVLRVAGVALAVGVIYLMDAHHDRGGEGTGYTTMLILETKTRA